MSRVELKYDGSKQPEHLQKGYNFQGVEFPHGEVVGINAGLAGHLLATCEKDSFTVISGEPTAYNPISASDRRALEAERTARRTFDRDAARELEGIAPVNAKFLEIARVKDPKAAVAAIEKGDLDKELLTIALWAAYGGRKEIAAAAVRRHEAVRLAPR